MQNHLSDSRITELIKKLVSSPTFSPNRDTSALIYDLPYLKKRLHRIRSAFGPNAFHTIAVKASPIPALLRYVKEQGFGLEAASSGELEIARKSGYPDTKVIFDSPVKTFEELEYALARNIHINADSLAELERIDEIKKRQPSQSNIGLRINPQVGIGTIAITSVAGAYSKFGVPLNERRNEIIDAYLKYPWLNGIHLHVGSQGCDPPMLVKGISRVAELVKEIHRAFADKHIQRRIIHFDIGGGLPISYHRNSKPFSIQEYAKMLEKECPELFTSNYRLITEFGRYIHTNAGFAITRVEYVKNDRDINTAMVHAGANMFIREAYHPGQWKHEISVATPEGRIKSGRSDKPWVIAGPLCFAGDMIAQAIYLPQVEAGDYIIVHDSGAYTLSMWSEYNSRQKPRAFGIDEHENIRRLSD